MFINAHVDIVTTPAQKPLTTVELAAGRSGLAIVVEMQVKDAEVQILAMSFQVIETETGLLNEYKLCLIYITLFLSVFSFFLMQFLFVKKCCVFIYASLL